MYAESSGHTLSPLYPRAGAHVVNIYPWVPTAIGSSLCWSCHRARGNVASGASRPTRGRCTRNFQRAPYYYAAVHICVHRHRVHVYPSQASLCSAVELSHYELVLFRPKLFQDLGSIRSACRAPGPSRYYSVRSCSKIWGLLRSACRAPGPSRY